MRVNPYLVVTTFVFALVALLHVLRLVYEMPVVIGTLQIPVAWSWLGLAVAGGLGAWAFMLLRQRK